MSPTALHGSADCKPPPLTPGPCPALPWVYPVLPSLTFSSALRDWGSGRVMTIYGSGVGLGWVYLSSCTRTPFFSNRKPTMQPTSRLSLFHYQFLFNRNAHQLYKDPIMTLD
mmetsp:Transcript_44616/g.72641  ORF Transcript_44616/g.72641 Transcript_44616/m.72641 type:complete len:112 (+) Transcript_44616:415-750(+)